MNKPFLSNSTPARRLTQTSISQFVVKPSTYRMNPSSAADQTRLGHSGWVASLLTRLQWHEHTEMTSPSGDDPPVMSRTRTVESAAHVARMQGDTNWKYRHIVSFKFEYCRHRRSVHSFAARGVALASVGEAWTIPAVEVGKEGSCLIHSSPTSSGHSNELDSNERTNIT